MKWSHHLTHWSLKRSPQSELACDENNITGNPEQQRLLVCRGVFLSVGALRWTANLNQQLTYPPTLTTARLWFRPSWFVYQAAQISHRMLVWALPALFTSLPSSYDSQRSFRETSTKYRPDLSLSGSFERKAAVLLGATFSNYAISLQHKQWHGVDCGSVT